MLEANVNDLFLLSVLEAARKRYQELQALSIRTELEARQMADLALIHGVP